MPSRSTRKTPLLTATGRLIGCTHWKALINNAVTGKVEASTQVIGTLQELGRSVALAEALQNHVQVMSLMQQKEFHPEFECHFTVAGMHADAIELFG